MVSHLTSCRMSHDMNSHTRRNALKKGSIVISSLAVGLPAISGTAAAVHIPQMIVDVPPAISPRPRGNVTVAIYPGGDFENMGELLETVEESEGGFTLGPHDEDDVDPDPDELNSHAEAVRWRLVNNGIHGESLGVFFDAATAEENEWFTSDDDAAKVSAVRGGLIEEDDDIISWGFDSVFIMDEEGQPQIE